MGQATACSGLDRSGCHLGGRVDIIVPDVHDMPAPLAPSNSAGSRPGLSFECSTHTCCAEAAAGACGIARAGGSVEVQQPSTPKGSPSKLPRARPTTLPAFAVPLGVDPYNEEGYRSGKTLERFVAMLTRGVGVNLAMDGCGTLHVVASLDAQCTLLHLVYNGVDKTIPLSFIRSLAVDLFYAGQTPPVKQRVSEKPRAWCVCMELGDKHFCTFVFGDNQAGQREATFFAQCMRMLSESVRFESTKLELQQISFGKLPLESPHASARTVVSEDIGIPSATEGLNALALDVALRNLRSERSHRRGIDAC